MSASDCCAKHGCSADGSCPSCPGREPLEPSPVEFGIGHVTRAICWCVRDGKADLGCEMCGGRGEVFETD